MVHKWMLRADWAMDLQVFNSRRQGRHDTSGWQVTSSQVSGRTFISAQQMMHSTPWPQSCWEDRCWSTGGEIKDQALCTCSFFERRRVRPSQNLWNVHLSVHWEIEDNISGVERPCLQQRTMKTEDFWTKRGNATGAAVVGTPYPCTVELKFAPTVFGHRRRNVVMRWGSESQVSQCGCEHWAVISSGLEDGDILNCCWTWGWEVSFRLQPVYLWEGSSW
jgi:hypothetical protein